MSRPVPEHEQRLRAARAAYPQGHSGDDKARLLVTIRADDLDALLGDVNAYRKTADIADGSERGTPISQLSGRPGEHVLTFPTMEQAKAVADALCAHPSKALGGAE